MSASLNANVKLGTKSLTVNKTAAFTVSGRQYTGVVTLGGGTELVVEQVASGRGRMHHFIKTADGMYLAMVTTPSGLPADVKRLVGSAKQFLTTTKTASKLYLVTATTTAVNSTVDITAPPAKIYIGMSSNFWVNSGNAIAIAPRRGAIASLTPKGVPKGAVAAPAASRAAPAPATVTITKEVAPRVGPIAVSVGDTARGMHLDAPHGAGLPTPSPFDFQAPVAKIATSAPEFGRAVAITADSRIVAVAATNAVSIYENDIPTLKLKHTIPAVGAELVGRAMRMSHDASVVAFDAVSGASSELKIFVAKNKTWEKAPVQNLPALKASTALGAGDLEMSSDGGVIAICGDNQSKALFVAEDTSTGRDWSTANVEDLTSAVNGPSVLNIALSPEGQWLYVASSPTTIELFRRDKCGAWVNSQMTVVGGYPGHGICRLITSYSGALVMAADRKGLLAFRRINDATLAAFPALGGEAVDPTSLSQLAATAHFTTVLMTTDTEAVASVARLAGGFSDVALPKDKEAPTLRSIAVSASGVHPMVVAGSPKTGEARVYWQGLNTDQAHLLANRLVMGPSAAHPLLTVEAGAGVRLGGDLFLNGRMTDPMEASALDEEPTVEGSANEALSVEYGEGASRYVRWYRNGDIVQIQGTVEWRQMMEGGSGVFRVVTKKPWPVPSDVGGGIYGAAWFAKGADVLGASIVAKVVSDRIVEFYELSPTGGEMAIDAGTDAMAPHVVEDGKVSFSVSFLTQTS